jgi:hypothetical protein
MQNHGRLNGEPIEQQLIVTITRSKKGERHLLITRTNVSPIEQVGLGEMLRFKGLMEVNKQTPLLEEKLVDTAPELFPQFTTEDIFKPSEFEQKTKEEWEQANRLDKLLNMPTYDLALIHELPHYLVSGLTKKATFVRDVLKVTQKEVLALPFVGPIGLGKLNAFLAGYGLELRKQ